MTNPLTQQELDHLAEVREVYQTVNTGGWRRIREQMQRFVDEAMESMVGAMLASDSVKAGLQTRWQQRVLMLRGIDQYVALLEAERKQLLEESKPQPSVPREDQFAESDREVTGWTN